ncbi:sarcotoxin-1A-like [Episyrphus balteatus]|uniref:sarcotoxin-1A-like n=1 Tax=Episyrphus balteatus TaxID=286459 RepID=UPI002485D8FA|nr:sarcotoxin-1A-like [Episyrphus balteatus]
MNFANYFIVIAVIMLVMFTGKSEADFWKKLGKGIEGVGQRTRNATIQGFQIAKQATNVVATAIRG